MLKISSFYCLLIIVYFHIQSLPDLANKPKWPSFLLCSFAKSSSCVNNLHTFWLRRHFRLFIFFPCPNSGISHFSFLGALVPFTVQWCLETKFCSLFKVLLFPVNRAKNITYTIYKCTHIYICTQTGTYLHLNLCCNHLTESQEFAKNTLNPIQHKRVLSSFPLFHICTLCLWQ